MKNIMSSLFSNHLGVLLLAAFLFSQPNLQAQTVIELPTEMGATAPDHQDGPCITPEQYTLLHDRMANNRKMLKEQGKLVFPEDDRSPIVALKWPLTYTADFYDFDYYVITNFVDQEPDSNNLKDWNCGTRTYDTGSYDHDGMDIAIAPSGWNLMAAQKVNIIAAAGGVIIDKNDGEFDTNCALGGGLPANYVVLEHFDGSTTLYTHMKNGSVTTKNIGDWVNSREYLGNVGSSGNSTGPHLHFEVRDENGDLIDPYSGSCNDLNVSSWWEVQKPYFEPAIIKMQTLSSAVVDDPSCAVLDNIPEKNHFSDNDDIRFQYYVRDIQPGDTILFNVYRPNGTQKWTSTNAYNGNYLTLANFILTPTFGNEPSGTWKWEVTYKGKVYPQYFTIDCTDHYDMIGAHSGRKGTIAGNYITSVATISSNASNDILYEAENYIRLDPGFQATAGSRFLAKIDPCNAGGTLAPEVGNPDNTVSSAKPAPVMQIYPNPFSDELTVSIPSDKTEKTWNVRLTDVAGRVFISQSCSNCGQISLATGSLPGGIYFVVLETEGISLVDKVVK